MRITIIKFIFLFFSFIPLSINHAIGTVIGRAYNLLPNRKRHVTNINLSLCFPEIPVAQRKQLAARSLIEVGKMLAEAGPMWFWQKDKILSSVKATSGEQAFNQAVQLNKGVVLAMPHLGCWEVANLYCSIQYPITILYQPIGKPGLDQLMCKARQRFGAKMEPTNTAGIRSLYKTLRSGGLISILPDQEPDADNGIFAPFFNVQTLTMTLLSRMAIKYHATVFYVYAQRLEDSSGYHIHFIEANKKIHDSELLESVETLNKGVEECIRSIPEQYLWAYKRFKSRPEGEAQHY